MTTRIKLRRDTATNWTTANPILAAGEPGLETDTGKVKYGNGTSTWSQLSYGGGDGGGGSLTSTSSIEIETGDADRWFVRLRREDNEVDPGFKGVTVYSTNYDSEGNAIVVGRIELYSDDGVVVAKFTSAGELVWKKSIGAVDNSRYPESNAVVDSDDNILLAVNPDDTQLKNIVKINGSTGAVIFSEELAFTEDFNIRAMAVDSNNNIIIGGDFFFPSSGETTGFVAKLNPTATDITWQKSLTVDSGFSAIASVAVDFNNDIIAVGGAEVEHTVNGATETDSEILVAKITASGGSSWQKSVRLDSETPQGGAFNVSLDSVGNSYVTGTYYVDNAESDSFSGGPNSKKSNAVFLFKMTTLGAIVWDRRVGPGQCDWVGVSTAVGDDGDLYLLASTYQRKSAGQADSSLGYWNATLALARYNKTTGAVVWQSYFDNPNSQEIPGDVNDAPWSDGVADNISVQGDKILIGGAVRLGASGLDLEDGTPNTDEDYFTQGFVAQFDTAATAWSAEGWSLSTSRIPGRLTNTLVAVNGPTALQTDITMTEEGSAGIVTQAVGISVRRTSSKVNTWTFGKDGTFTAPADADIRLQQRQLGYATMYGLFPNDDSDIWFESVCHDAEGFAYVIGSDAWFGNRAHIYKFTPEGAVVWQRELFSGDGAQFTVVVTTGTYATPTVTNGGNGYKVGDRILIDGDDLGGNASNTLVLEVASILEGTDYVGEVDTVTIVSGVGATGLSTTTSVQDFDDNAECEIRSMAYNPVSGNIVVVVTTPTSMGDSLDSGWTETVILTIDSGSGTVVSTTTLQDEGDIYAYDIDISSTGKIAVVGEKFNEYAEYGTITPLAGSAVDKLWVTKADIDAEHFPGESIPGGSSSGDWWITGTGITDQAQVTSVNYYEGLTGTLQQGSGATFNIINNGNGTYSAGIVNSGTNYLVGHKIKILGTSLTGAENLSTFTQGVEYTAGQVNFAGTGGIFAPWYVGVDSTLTSIISLITTGTTLTLTVGGATTSTSVVTVGEFEGNALYEVGDLSFFGTSGYNLDSITVSDGTYGTGATPANDIIITVDAVEAGVISSVSNVGTATGISSATATAVSGTNYNTGSGAVFFIYFNATTGAVDNGSWSSAGTNYVVGDVITILGTNFAGGTTSTNNLIVTASSVSGTALETLNFSGTHSTTHLQIATNDTVDYAATGTTFAIKQNLGGEAFVWTPDMTPVIGGASNDQFSGVAWNAAGTHLYAVGQGQYEVNYDQALVVKFSSTGTIVASKFVNNNMGENNAYSGAVALMANDSIVVVHEMYNDGRDETDEVLVTKLDSNLNIIWQQFIGIGSSNGGSWYSPESNISVAVDPATDEIVIAWEFDDDFEFFDDQAIAIVKLDTDGEFIWKRMWGVYESDTQMCYESQGNKALSIHGDQFTLVGFTDAPDDGTDNAFIVTLPLDGTGVGEQGIWKYVEPNDDRIKVWRLSGNTATTFTATVQTSSITAADNIKHYYTDYPNENFTFYPHTILSNEGGAIEFADGSRQTFSTAIVPQVRISAGGYTLRPEDSGRHILIEDSDYAVIIPNWQRVSLPVGYTVTLINISGSDAYVECEDSDNLRGQMWFSGGDDKTAYIGINDNGSGQMITLIKIKEGTESDDSENHGDIWMVAGADIYNND
jgi:hypothetical protein